MSNLRVFTFENINVGDTFKFVGGKYAQFTGYKNSDDGAWMGTEYFIEKHGIPQVISVNANERVYLYPEQ